MEDCVNDRSVMPLDVLGRTCATRSFERNLNRRENINHDKLHRKGDRSLEIMVFNEECLVSVCHYQALNKFLPFVHTALRSYPC